MTEHQWHGALQAAREGDPEGFAALYRALQPGLLRYLRALVGQEAEDLAAETWAQAVRDLGRFHGAAEDFRPWLVTIGRHRALDLLKTRRARGTDPWDPSQLPEGSGPADTAELAEEAQATQRALALIATLPPDQAEAVLLRVVVGLDAPQAARVLGKRAGAVRMATSRGLATLAARLAPPGDPQGVTPEGSRSLKEVR